ncbi:flavodoxin family protein [Clostridium botulinum]|uniref:Flavodoxin family protein n=1 Tax=Clostridium botulinum TaxID=1491 RepID=A0A6G4CLZ8_CLOBO|nr:flavodoxin family protein [Clostridium botulinum]NEZ99794.1 flavodoxin family protein [Clostridium botulinum]NFA31240.1 flavodoxin family protein [Clostridium botulinum]NFA85441.1 flavodoxin family protein [Clostridium botulinum]NFB27703.1 flavodoxin family protein [Clostridium botulinum]
MKVLGINGSPRKQWNTAALLTKALEGVASLGVETELIHLYNLNYKGCVSCFACKLIDGRSYGRCAINDDLGPILKKIEECDAIIMGSPIYFGQVTGEMKSFLERLLFQYLVYDGKGTSLLKKKILTGFIYTMNVNENILKDIGYDQNFKAMEKTLIRFFGSSESLIVTDTYQFDDYSKYVTTGLDAQAKTKRNHDEFPKDCLKAFNMGVRFAQQINAD